MKQVQQKLKIILYYIPSGCYDAKDKGYFFMRCNDKKKEIKINKSGNKADMTVNEILAEIKTMLEGELGKDE